MNMNAFFWFTFSVGLLLLGGTYIALYAIGRKWVFIEHDDTFAKIELPLSIAIVGSANAFFYLIIFASFAGLWELATPFTPAFLHLLLFLCIPASCCGVLTSTLVIRLSIENSMRNVPLLLFPLE